MQLKILILAQKLVISSMSELAGMYFNVSLIILKNVERTYNLKGSNYPQYLKLINNKHFQEGIPNL